MCCVFEYILFCLTRVCVVVAVVEVEFEFIMVNGIVTFFYRYKPAPNTTITKTPTNERRFLLDGIYCGYFIRGYNYCVDSVC